MKVGYLGPEGTFTQEALSSQENLAGQSLLEYASITEVITAVHNKEINMGIVPVENALEGTVRETLDQLIFYSDVLIQKEIVIDINLYLLGLPQAKLKDIKSVISYPHAYSQCRQWIKTHLGSVELKAANSTADAAKFVKKHGKISYAAVAPRLAAELYGLKILAKEIQDQSTNQTRFILISADGIPRPTGHDKTSIVCFQKKDRPGSLHAILGEFSARNINLTKLESRPSREGLGQYCFVIDLEGHISNPVVGDCIKTLYAELADVKFLGSYPRAGVQAEQLRTNANRSWQRAELWYSGLLSKMEQ
jgi:prephenate dehydratase